MTIMVSMIKTSTELAWEGACSAYWLSAVVLLGETRQRMRSDPYARISNMTHSENSPKKATGLTLKVKALAVGREMGMNVSQVVDALLQEEARRRYREKRLVENQEAVAEYNERVKREGVFSDGLRGF